MKRKERFLAALRMEVPDRVPMTDFIFQQPLYGSCIDFADVGSSFDRTAVAKTFDDTHNIGLGKFGILHK